jgi:hypothetical protein
MGAKQKAYSLGFDEMAEMKAKICLVLNHLD